MSAIRLALSLVFLAGFICAQNDIKPEIRGSVIESGPNIGIAGAEITLFEFLEDRDRFVVRTPVATAYTDARGAFRFELQHFGDYYVEAKKETYVASLNGEGGKPAESAGTPASVKPDHPSEEVRFSLMRPGEITGRVMDEDGNPVSGLRIAVENKDFGASPNQTASSVTNLDGSFTVKVAPGEYLLRTVPKSGDFVTAMPEFSEADLKTVDQDVASEYWPGGVSEFAAASPIPVSPAASSSLGTITVRKKPYYRAHVVLAGADCAPKQNLMFSAIPKAPPLTANYSGAPCGSDILLRNLRPGGYWFFLRGGSPREAKWAVADVEVARENVEVPMAMLPSVEIAGRFVAAEGVRLPALPKISVMLQARLGAMLVASTPAAVDAEGAFTAKDVPPVPHEIAVRGLGERYYIQEIRYNNVVIANGKFLPVRSPTRNLEIVLDDQPATITGTVREGDKPVSKPYVLVVKWPFREGDPLSAERPAGDDQGRFRISGLAPGEYRVLALTKNIVNTQVSTLLLDRAEKITLERGSSKDISLKPVDPAK